MKRTKACIFLACITCILLGLAITGCQTTKATDNTEATVSNELESSPVVATSDIELPLYDNNGKRMTYYKETTIGNLCADAFRVVGKADIGLINGGGIRAGLPFGDITFDDIMAIYIFKNRLCKVVAKGQQILDCLEFSCKNFPSIYEPEGYFSGFQSVSGLKFTVDTSIQSSVTMDSNGMFTGVEGERRVNDVFVLNGEKWIPLDPNGTYTVASHNFLLKDGGDGFSMFQNDEFLINNGMKDSQVLITYIADILKGKLKDKYSDIEGRIFIK